MDRLPLLSSDWYRVAFLRPRMRPGVRVTRQLARGETWYVLSDPLSGRHHRFNAAAYGLIACCDGRRSIDEVWAMRVETEGDAAPTQSQAIEVYARAFAANLFTGDVAPDARAAMRMHDRQRAQRLRTALNPFAFRVPLFDPEPLLERHVDRVRWLFAADAWRVIALLVAVGALLLVVNAEAFAQFARSELGSGRLLVAMWLVYPLIKAVHEAAHAFAVKVYGGEVREVGITLMMLTPVPYVDASASTAFARRQHRFAVAVAGIAVEALLATGALVLWLLSEPGLLNDIAFAVAFVGGVSTLLVNGNPLLRFDGYHALVDALETPNLALRSNQFLQYQLKRLLGLKRLRRPHVAPRETGWLLAYAPLSWLYRSVLLATFSVAAAAWHPLLGLTVLLLGIWFCLAKPLAGLLKWLTEAAELHGQRARAWGAAGFAATLAGAIVVAMPLPQRTHAPGLVWLPDEAVVRPDTEGFVVEHLVRDGDAVEAGTPLLRLENEALRVQLAGLEAEVRQYEVETAGWFGIDATRRGLAADRLQRAQAERDRLAQRVAALELRADIAGRVALDEHRLLRGRFVTQGEVVAHVLPAQAPLVRALVANDDIELVRDAAEGARVSLAHDGGGSVQATIERYVPRASRALPTPALGEAAGGPLALDPADPEGRTSAEPRFEVDLRLPPGTPAHIGTRALVTFLQGETTLVSLAARALRRTFLRHFER